MMPRGRAILAVAALAAQAAAVIVAAPAARATDTSGFSPSIYTTIDTVPAGSRGSFASIPCPSGTTPIAGGFRNEAEALIPYQEYVNWGDGTSFDGAVENRAPLNDESLTVYVRCVAASRLSATSRAVATFAENNSTHNAGGYTTCPSGSYALSARVDWNNTVDEQGIEYSSPTWDLRGWVVSGYNAGTGNYMIVDVQCGSSASLPGAYLVHTQQENTSSNGAYIGLAAICPDGMAAVNGGSFTQRNGDYSDFSHNVGIAYASYPTPNGWEAEAFVPGKTSTDDYIMYVTTWCIPNVEPALDLTGPRPIYTNSATAQFQFTASDPAAAGGYALSFRCALDGESLDRRGAECTSPWTRTVTIEGHHTATVRVTTSDGRSALATYDWYYDKTAPTAATTAPTAPFTLAAGVPVAWSGSDGSGTGVGSYNVRYRTASYTDPGYGTYRYPARLQGVTTTTTRLHSALGATNCYSAQAVDLAGNQSPYSPPRCTARPVDDRALIASSGWTAGSDAADWNGTYRRTTTHGAILTLASVSLDRVGIVATTCAGCGKVAILVAGTQVGTIDLAARATHHRAILALPAFSARSGDVVIKVVSTGQRVDIDGLATSHA